MTLFHLFLLAAIQGLTEFLPVSSSGHLILLPALTGLPDQGQSLDVAVHVGTLGAVILYFRHDVGLAARGLPKVLRWQLDGREAWLALCLIVATVPIVLFGIFLALTGLNEALRSVTVIGVTMVGFGIVLYVTDQREDQSRTAADWTLRDALTMGLWQALALIPGTSRSGIAISAARQLGYARPDAARLAMLMSIPAITASGTYLGVETALTGDFADFGPMALAALFAFVAALLALAIMMRLLRVVSFTPYVIYRIILGAGLIWYGLGGVTLA